MKPWCIVLLFVLTACGNEAAPPQPPAPAPSAPALPAEVVPDERGHVHISVDGSGFHPATIHARAGQPLTLVFTRTADVECAREVVFPDQQLRRELALDRPVEIAVVAPPSGRLAFTCGMDMLRGAIVAHAGE